MADGDPVEGHQPRQGDYLPDVPRIYLLGEAGDVSCVETPVGVLLLTQCCDLAREGSGEAHVAAVVELSASEVGNAKSGRTPRYIPLEAVSERQLFADLGLVGGMTHAAVANQRRIPGVPEGERHRVGDRVARRFSRFAYPDEVVPVLGWVVRKIRSKAQAAESPLGRLLGRVDRIRVEVDGDWAQPPWSITLLFIVADGELPTLGDGPPSVLGAPSDQSLSGLATAIADAEPGSGALGPLWDRFGETLARDALAASSPSPRHVADLRVEVIEESDLSFARYRRTSPLDVDHISGAAVD